MSSTITVKVAKLPGPVQEIMLNGGRKVSDALAAANMEVDGHSVKVNGGEVDLTADLRNGDTVLLLKRIKGNS